MIRFAYLSACAARIAAPRQLLLAIALVGAVGQATGGCSAGVKATPTGTGGNAGTGTAGTQGGGGNGMAGTIPSFGGSFGGGMAPDGGCQQADYHFEPKIPTAYLLVDRSGSMFHCLTGDTGSAVCSTPANTAWSNLKEATRSVLGLLDADVRFGF